MNTAVQNRTDAGRAHYSKPILDRYELKLATPSGHETQHPECLFAANRRCWVKNVEVWS